MTNHVESISGAGDVGRWQRTGPPAMNNPDKGATLVDDVGRWQRTGSPAMNNPDKGSTAGGISRSTVKRPAGQRGDH
jgi:hypothetical protein